MNKVPVGKSIAYAYSFTFGHLSTVLGLGWLPVLLFTACSYFTFHAYLDGLIQFLRDENPSSLGPAIVLFLLGLVVAMALCAVLAVVLTRQALGLRNGGAKIYFAFGRTEWRTLGALLRLALVLLLLGVLLSIALGIAGGIAGILTRVPDQVSATGEVVSPAVTLTMTLLGLAGLAGLFYVFVRISFLVVAVTAVGDEAEPLRAAWNLGRDNFWRMFLVQLATMAPIVLLQQLAGNLFGGPMPAVGGAPGSTENMIGEVLALQSTMPLAMVINGVGSLLLFPLIYSAQAFAYRALVPPAPVTYTSPAYPREPIPPP